MPDLHEIDLSNILEIRKAIQTAGAEIYNSFPPGFEKNIAGEFLALNENYVWYEVNAAEGLTIGCEEILKTGFTKNQRDWLSQLYHSMQMWDHARRSIVQPIKPPSYMDLRRSDDVH